MIWIRHSQSCPMTSVAWTCTAFKCCLSYSYNNPLQLVDYVRLWDIQIYLFGSIRKICAFSKRKKNLLLLKQNIEVHKTIGKTISINFGAILGQFMSTILQ